MNSRSAPVVALVLVALALSSSADGVEVRWGPSNGPPGPVVALAVDPKDPLTVYAGTRTVWKDGDVASHGSLYRSTNGGRRWIASNSDGGIAVAVDPRRRATVYVSTEYDGVMRSLDAGRTWRPANRGLGELTASSIAIDPKRTTTLYAGTGVDYGSGVFKSTDAVRRWRPSGFADYFVDALVVDPQAPATLFAAIWDPQMAHEPNRFARSTDGGRSWVTPEPGLSSLGSLAAAPRGSVAVFAGTRRGVFKSTDRGLTWSATANGPREVTAIVIDPLRPNVVYAATYGSGVFRSVTAGRSWVPFNGGLKTPALTSLALSSDGRVLYAGSDRGVFRIHVPR